MTKISDHKRRSTAWYSPPFYTHPHGYKVCLEVIANYKSEGAFMTIGAHLLPGEFDDFLRRPCQSIVIYEMVNQLNDKQHYRYTQYARVQPRHRMPVSQRRRLHLRVIQVTDTGWNLIEKQCSAIESLICTPPIEFTMQEFEQHRKTDNLWHSPSFYTHSHGYRMRLRVIANGLCAYRGTHVSLFVHIMRGEFDSYLKWPFRGNVTLQLLNRFSNKRHHEITIHFTDATPDTHAGRVISGERGRSWGDQKFISHHKLSYNSANNCQYLENDCPYFRVTNVVLAI